MKSYEMIRQKLIELQKNRHDSDCEGLDLVWLDGACGALMWVLNDRIR